MGQMTELGIVQAGKVQLDQDWFQQIAPRPFHSRPTCFVALPSLLDGLRNSVQRRQWAQSGCHHQWTFRCDVKNECRAGCFAPSGRCHAGDDLCRQRRVVLGGNARNRGPVGLQRPAMNGSLGLADKAVLFGTILDGGELRPTWGHMNRHPTGLLDTHQGHRHVAAKRPRQPNAPCAGHGPILVVVRVIGRRRQRTPAGSRACGISGLMVIIMAIASFLDPAHPQQKRRLVSGNPRDPVGNAGIEGANSHSTCGV